MRANTLNTVSLSPRSGRWEPAPAPNHPRWPRFSRTFGFTSHLLAAAGETRTPASCRQHLKACEVNRLPWSVSNVPGGPNCSSTASTASKQNRHSGPGLGWRQPQLHRPWLQHAAPTALSRVTRIRPLCQLRAIATIRLRGPRGSCIAMPAAGAAGARPPPRRKPVRTRRSEPARAIEQEVTAGPTRPMLARRAPARGLSCSACEPRAASGQPGPRPGRCRPPRFPPQISPERQDRGHPSKSSPNIS